MKNIAKVLAMIMVLVIVGASAQYLFREARADSVYTNAIRGQSEAEILSRLGAPDEVQPCGDYLLWNGNQSNPPKNTGQCEKWIRYNFFLHAFAFGYSDDGKLVSRFEYSSE